ncbi:hypothetical protein ACVIGB_004266 [Bradyrhizobium sp. USDA 4341]
MIAFPFASRKVAREREIERILNALNVLTVQRAVAITSRLPQDHLDELATEEANYRRRARELGAAGLSVFQKDKAPPGLS